MLFSTSVAFASDISAKSYVTIDMSSGDVILSKDCHAQYPMASTTKIMTCLLACESGKLDDIVTITPDMLDSAIGSMIYLAVDDKISLLDLVKGAMLSSGNDAANAIAVYLAGDIKSFVSIMNDRAKRIGMTNTTFVTPSGLDEGIHHSTAYDMALLSRVALSNKAFSSICALSKDDILISGEPRTIYNHNKLLSIDGFCGVKTGYTDKAGRCLVSAYKYNDNTIITVTLNAPNDWSDHKVLVEKSKEYYTHYLDTVSYNIPIVGAKKSSVKCSAEFDVFTHGDIKLKAYYYPFCYAPIHCGDKIGYLKIFNDKKQIKTVEIIALEEIEKWQITK